MSVGLDLLYRSVYLLTDTTQSFIQTDDVLPRHSAKIQFLKDSNHAQFVACFYMLTSSEPVALLSCFASHFYDQQSEAIRLLDI